MRVCLVYDCLYPFSVGGAERWYRSLAERLDAAGAEVTYLTLRQWPRGADPRLGGVDVVAVGPRMQLYTGGRRRILPPLVFGLGVLVHLLRHGRRYDAVQTASFPYFSLLAAASARRLHRYRLVVDWVEIWTREYWREYLGRLGGIGWWVQGLCARTRHRAFAYSRLHAERLRSLGFRGEVTVLEGLYAGGHEPPEPIPAEPLVVFAGRLIPEKRAPALVPAIGRARERLPELRCTIFGDGPDRPNLLRLIADSSLDRAVEAPGFVEANRVEAAMRRALCFVLPSRREGYGLAVVEAAALGTPSIVVSHPDNAAAELVEDGVNGVVAPSAEPDELAAAILRVHEAGEELRASTRDWYRRNARRLSIDTSFEHVLAAYGE
ncbi:MAG TPA: glycosyltransferase [Gaiellaceae bacterium]|nr:glycosyltransferase [Gaiellaceae bacterium]